MESDRSPIRSATTNPADGDTTTGGGGTTSGGDGTRDPERPPENTSEIDQALNGTWELFLVNNVHLKSYKFDNGNFEIYIGVDRRPIDKGTYTTRSINSNTGNILLNISHLYGLYVTYKGETLKVDPNKWNTSSEIITVLYAQFPDEPLAHLDQAAVDIKQRYFASRSLSYSFSANGNTLSLDGNYTRR